MQCKQGYGLQDGKCAACTVANCGECYRGVDTCIECAAGYGRSASDSNVCLPCEMEGCSNCSGLNTNCNNCMNTYEFDAQGVCKPKVAPAPAPAPAPEAEPSPPSPSPAPAPGPEEAEAAGFGGDDDDDASSGSTAVFVSALVVVFTVFLAVLV